MYIWIFILLSVFSGFYFSPDRYIINQHLKSYEIVDCHVWAPKVKRSSSAGDPKRKIYGAADAEVQFRSRGKDFHLLLHEDKSYQNINVESYSLNKSAERIRIKSKIYEGVLRNETFSSYVVGYLHDGVFSGTINMRNSVYFVEPARMYFTDMAYAMKVVIYREVDIREQKLVILRRNSLDDLQDRAPFSILDRWRDNTRNYNFFRSGINKSSSIDGDYACVIEMVADHTLFEYFQKNTDAVSAFLYLHGKYTDFVFRRTDFDGDGKPDRIRIIVGKIFIYKSEMDSDYPMAKASSLRMFLERFSERIQNYCLSVSICHRETQNLVIGQAYKATNENFGPPGGICQEPIRHFSAPRVIYRSFNTAVVTIRSSHGTTLPLRTTLLAVAHEVGHGFGSNHDSAEDLSCSPGGDKGFYLMFPKTFGEVKPLNEFFSPCSRRDINTHITAKGHCLKSHPASCGNGVREGNEECDCGWVNICHIIDPCCTPSDAQSSDKGCTFRRKMNAFCSPKENICCTERCTVITDKKTQCYNDDNTCLISFCDGKSGECPKPQIAPDTHPCKHTSKSCSGGICNSTVCLDHALKDCVCTDNAFECRVCCEKNGRCIPASFLGFFTPNGEEYKAIVGTSCKYNTFQCDGSGNCINPSSRNLNITSTKASVLWLTVGGLTAVFLLIVFSFSYIIKDLYERS